MEQEQGTDISIAKVAYAMAKVAKEMRVSEGDLMGFLLDPSRFHLSVNVSGIEIRFNRDEIEQRIRDCCAEGKRL
jgi:hypothetical protein